MRWVLQEMSSLSNAEVEDCLWKPVGRGRGSAQLELLLQPFAEWQDAPGCLQRSSPLVELERACDLAGNVEQKIVGRLFRQRDSASHGRKAWLADANAESGADTSTRRAVRMASGRHVMKIPSPSPGPHRISLPKPLPLPNTVAPE